MAHIHSPRDAKALSTIEEVFSQEWMHLSVCSKIALLLQLANNIEKKEAHGFFPTKPMIQDVLTGVVDLLHRIGDAISENETDWLEEQLQQEANDQFLSDLGKL